jgi:hypothetical protein
MWNWQFWPGDTQPCKPVSKPFRFVQQPTVVTKGPASLAATPVIGAHAKKPPKFLQAQTEKRLRSTLGF